jgi:hypothetical protein
LKKEIVWPDQHQTKACGFVRLGSYLHPGGAGSLKNKGVYSFLIFVLLPLTQQPWRATYTWLSKSPQGLFVNNTWVSASGPIIGTLSYDNIEDFPDTDRDKIILIVTPDSFETTTSSTLANQTKPISKFPITPNQKTRNPFSSPTTRLMPTLSQSKEPTTSSSPSKDPIDSNISSSEIATLVSPEKTLPISKSSSEETVLPFSQDPFDDFLDITEEGIYLLFIFEYIYTNILYLSKEVKPLSPTKRASDLKASDRKGRAKKLKD